MNKKKYFGRLHSNPPSNKKIIRKILNKNRGKSIRLFEEIFSNKILFDIAYILNMGWSNELSRKDFFHGHGFFRRYISLSNNYESNLKTIISKEHMDLNYHTKELIRPRGKDWNIYSPSNRLPMVIDSNLHVRGLIYFHFCFDLNPTGQYILQPNKSYPEKQKVSLEVSMMNQ